MQTLFQQYELVQSSREAVFKYCETFSHKDFVTGLDNFGGRGIRYLLVHVANTYLFWLGNFSQKKSLPYYKDESVNSVQEIRKIFERTDALVQEFLMQFDGKLESQVSGDVQGQGNINVTPLSLFTHVITHEFHHKGQIMSMSRQLGYTPPDTDIIRFS